MSATTAVSVPVCTRCTGELLVRASFVGLCNLAGVPSGQNDAKFAFSRMDEMKAGRLVGQDKYGNKYFEDRSQFYGRNRWVEYAPHFNLEYDGSQIPAEWFGWMHYKVKLRDC